MLFHYVLFSDFVVLLFWSFGSQLVLLNCKHDFMLVLKLYVLLACV